MKKVLVFLFLVNAFNFIEFGKCDYTDECYTEINCSDDYTSEDDADTSYKHENNSECGDCEDNDDESKNNMYGSGCEEDYCACEVCESGAESSCEGTELTSETSDCDDAYKQFLSVITKYGMKFLKEAMEENPVKSITISPWKILQFLGFHSWWAIEGSDLEKEIYKVFKIKDKNKLKCAILRAAEYENNIKSGLFYGAGVAAVNNKQYKFTGNATEELNRIGYKTFESNFGKRTVVATVDTLNEYLNIKTKGLVGDVIPYDVVNSSTKYLVANSLYSKVTVSVISTESVKKDFICAKFNVKEINYYLVTANTEYIECEKLKASVISFSSRNDYRLVLFVPNTTFGASNVLDNIINNPEALDKAMKNMRKENIQITIPGTDNLTKLFDGVSTVKKFVPSFFEENNYLNGLVRQNKPIYLTNGYQKITIQGKFIKNKTAVRLKSEPKVIELKYPFIYSIYYGDANFYTGIYNGCDN